VRVDRRAIGSPAIEAGKGQRHERRPISDQIMDNNVPNLNVEELAAYATAKSRAGLSDEEILQEITLMLREDGWKEAAIGPTIEAIVKRSAIIGGKGSPRQGSPPKANRDSVAVMMAQMMEMLSPIANRLEVLERKQSDRRSDASPTFATPPSPPPIETSQVPAHKRKFPDPERFDGTRDNYPGWKFECEGKLEYDRSMFPTKDAKIRYVLSRTKDKANQVLLPWVLENRGGSVAGLWEHMDTQFQDVHQQQRALDKLRHLRQGRRPVRDYVSEFNQLRVESRQEFSPAVARQMFSEGLNEELQKQMLHAPKNTSLKEYMDKAIELSDDLYRIQFHSKNKERTSTRRQVFSTAPQTAPQAEEMDWEPTRANRADTRRKRPKGGTSTCYACGKEGHFIRECPEVVKVRKARLARAQDEERSECSDSTSGKE